MSIVRTTAVLLAAAIIPMACTDQPNEPEMEVESVESLASAKGGHASQFAMDPAVQADIEERVAEYVRERATQIEEQRVEAGAELPAGVAVAPLGFAWSGRLDGETVGNEVFFVDRGNKQLDVQWVPGDPRRNGRMDIGYAVDDDFPLFYEAPGVSPTEAIAAIDRAMATWDAQNCSKGLEITRGDFLDWLFYDSDVLHEGFFILPEGVLGVTAPYIFTDVDTGEPTDIDGDGNLDYAYAIITYNYLYTWGIDSDVDVETIALHEMGHGLAQAHFGAAFATPSNGKVHFAPRSVMNAAYAGPLQSLTGTDRAGHCSMYGSWPNN